MRTLWSLSLGAVFAVSSACSDTSSLGTSDLSSTGNEPDSGNSAGSAGSSSADAGAAGGGNGSGRAGGSGAVSCTTSAECPDATCIECADRSRICPGFQCVGGQCLPERLACPDPIPCNFRADCPVTRGLCVQCPDGKMSCQDYACEQNVCVLVQPPCGQVDKPCGGKRCGDWCGACERNHPVCDIFPPFPYCNAAGECVRTEVVCE